MKKFLFFLAAFLMLSIHPFTVTAEQGRRSFCAEAESDYDEDGGFKPGKKVGHPGASTQKGVSAEQNRGGESSSSGYFLHEKNRKHQTNSSSGIYNDDAEDGS